MNEKVTVIVPVYNVEKYLEKCVESIINQTYQNLEIILIDDGSLDGSGRICDLFAKNDNRIKVIHKSNGGLSSARNIALDCCTGQYICFVDSDDYIEKNMIINLMKYIIDDDIDCVQFGYNVVKNDIIVTKMYNENQMIYPRSEILNTYFKTAKLNEIVWNKFYRADVFKKIRMIEGKNNEDYLVMPEILMSINKILNVKECLYNYVIRENSIMNTKFSSKKMDRIFAGEYVVDFCEKKIPEHIIDARINLCFICIYLCSELVYADIIEKKQYFNIIKKCFKNNYLLINKSKEFKTLSIKKKIFLVLGRYNIYNISKIYRLYLKKKMGE